MQHPHRNIAKLRVHQQHWGNDLRVRITRRGTLVYTVSQDECRHLARDLVDQVRIRWENSYGIGNLDVSLLDVKDNKVVLPEGNSVDYASQTAKFIRAIFGNSGAWTEREDFLHKLSNNCPTASEFARMYFHPFLQCAQERALDILNFYERVRYGQVEYDNGYFIDPMPWTKAYHVWEEEEHPLRFDDVATECSRHNHANLVYTFEGYQYNLASRATKIIIARNIIIHINKYCRGKASYGHDDMLSLIQYLFPNIGQLIYDFSWHINLDMDVLKFQNHAQFVY